MGEPLKELTAIEGLLPRDLIIARALIRNKFLEPGPVLEAARWLAQCNPDEYGEGLLDKLTTDGRLTQENAARIETALQQKLGQRKSGRVTPARPTGAASAPGAGGPSADAPEAQNQWPFAAAGSEGEATAASGEAVDADAPPETAPAEDPAEPQTETAPRGSKARGKTNGLTEAAKRGRLWTPRERHEPDPGDSSVALYEELQAKREARERKELETFIQRFINSRLHVALLEALAKRKAHAVDPKELVDETGVKLKDIRRILDEWKRMALIKTVGAYPYYYDPLGKDKTAIENFLRQWRNPKERPSIMKRLLELEGK